MARAVTVSAPVSARVMRGDGGVGEDFDAVAFEFGVDEGAEFGVDGRQDFGQRFDLGDARCRGW